MLRSYLLVAHTRIEGFFFFSENSANRKNKCRTLFYDKESSRDRRQ